MKSLFILFISFVLSLNVNADQSFGGLTSEAEGDLVEVSSIVSISSVQPGKTFRAATVVEIAPEWHINSASPYQEWLIPANLSFDTISGITPGNINYPLSSDAVLGGEKMSVYDGRLIIVFDVTVGNEVEPGEYELPVRFAYQPCNDRECRAPETIETKLKIEVGEEGRLIHQDIFEAFESGEETGQASTTPVTDESDLQHLINKYGFWGYFLALGLAFITGLLLSFSPCTYPMIPITVSIFAGQQRSIGRGFILSLFYVGTMALMYGIMGLVVSLVGGVFGAWLASTPVVIGIVIVFVIFALSMFGLYDLNIPSSLRQKLGTSKSGGGVIGAVVLGIIAALVVSPCVGPFVAGILLSLG